MRLQTATWPEVENYLTRSNGIIVPIGSTEQHGPNGMLGTDAICPETIAFGVAEKMEALIAPTLSIGQAHHYFEADELISLYDNAGFEDIEVRYLIPLLGRRDPSL